MEKFKIARQIRMKRIKCIINNSDSYSRIALCNIPCFLRMNQIERIIISVN